MCLIWKSCSFRTYFDGITAGNFPGLGCKIVIFLSVSTEYIVKLLQPELSRGETALPGKLTLNIFSVA